MSVDYSFYTNTYKGDSITENEFPRILARVTAQLDKYKRMWTVTVPDGVENAEEMALCSMADAFFYYETQQNGGYISSTIGSVSSSKGCSMDISTHAQDKEMLKCAEMYLDIYKGVGKW